MLFTYLFMVSYKHKSQSQSWNWDSRSGDHASGGRGGQVLGPLTGEPGVCVCVYTYVCRRRTEGAR